MKKLADYLGIGVKPGLLGIEVECEGENLQTPDAKYWNVEADGSLRPVGGFPHKCAEYVLKGPMTLESSIQALQNLEKVQSEAKLDMSYRCSVHVHVNCLELNEEQLLNFIYTYSILENVMVRYCGEERQYNRFCLKIRDAEYMLQYIESFVNQGFNAVVRFNGEHMRYAGMNLAALGKYGSIEFRNMRGTVDSNILIPWIKALLNIRKYALKSKNVQEIHESFIKNGHYKFLQDVLKEESDYFFTEHTKQDMAEAFSISYEIPVAWGKKNLQAEQEKKEKPKALKAQRIKVPQGELMWQPPAEGGFHAPRGIVPVDREAVIRRMIEEDQERARREFVPIIGE